MSSIVSTAGKGSSGKSITAAFVVRELVKHSHTHHSNGTKPPLLVVDMDPHGILTKLLIGKPANNTIGSLRHEFEQQIRSGKGVPVDETREEYLHRQIGERALIRQPGYDLLPMGHWQEVGCQCIVNRIVNDVLDHIANDYELIIIDNEAGIEHIGRHAYVNVDLLLLFSTLDPMFMDVAHQVLEHGEEVGAKFNNICVIMNRVPVNYMKVAANDAVAQREISERINGEAMQICLPETQGLMAVAWSCWGNDMARPWGTNDSMESFMNSDPWVVELRKAMEKMPVISEFIGRHDTEHARA